MSDHGEVGTPELFKGALVYKRFSPQAKFSSFQACFLLTTSHP